MDKVDYSNTLIYKIYCNDATNLDLYVGHTTNFVKRKLAHKYCCNNEKINNKLYNTIRQNGGWDNWKMDIVGFYNCDNLHEAKVKEQEFFISLNATLNSIEPISSKPIKTYVAKTVVVDAATTDVAVATVAGVADTVAGVSNNLLPYKFHCECCDFKCNKKSNYDIHVLTNKHILRYKKFLHDKNIQQLYESVKEIPELDDAYACTCGKTFKYHSGLWRHKKTCTVIPNELLPNNDLSDRELLIMLLNDNKEFKNIIMEQNNTIMALIENLQQINHSH